jgi:hypothetical protein
MMSKTIATLAFWFAVAAHGGELVVDAEVMEGAAVELPGAMSGTVRYAVLHHKHSEGPGDACGVAAGAWGRCDHLSSQERSGP